MGVSWDCYSLRTTDQSLDHKKTIDCDMALNKGVAEPYEQRQDFYQGRRSGGDSESGKPRP